MKTEPLTKEKERSMIDGETSTPSEEFFIHYFSSIDVRSAVELLKEKIANILEEGGIENPLVQDDSDWVLSQIDFCFPVFKESS